MSASARRPAARRTTAPRFAAGRLSHVSRDGSVEMVDVAAKEVTTRTAIAEAQIVMTPRALSLVRAGAAKKGDVLVTAQIAGILAAKRTAQLIPLCHPLPLAKIDVRCEPQGDDRIRIRCSVTCNARTGVEMEALTGCAVAALTVYDMVKAVDRGMVIERLLLVEKKGGKSGHFRRHEHARSR